MSDDESPATGTDESKTARGEDLAKGSRELGSVVDPAGNKVRTA